MPASTASPRGPRPTVRTTSVISAAGDGLAPASADIEAALRAAVVDAAEEVALAERALGRSRVARTRAALDLERHLHPLTLDEADRERLRAAYAAADAQVVARQSALADARQFEQAARTVAAALEKRGGLSWLSAAPAADQDAAARGASVVRRAPVSGRAVTRMGR
nr:hypothetical protein GCM10025699_03090 [Microbacterium flavescens]